MLDRRDFLTGAGAAVCAANLSGTVATSPQPNILIITTDQQSADAASYCIGNGYLNTPKIDSLDARGTSFTRASNSNPSCVPSRTSMYTGRYPTFDVNMPHSEG